MKKNLFFFILLAGIIAINSTAALATNTFVSVTSNGSVVTNAAVDLYGWDGGEWVMVSQGEFGNGYYFLGDLYPGEYRVVVNGVVYDIYIQDQQQQVISITL